MHNTHEGGFSTLEVIVALVLIMAAMLGSITASSALLSSTASAFGVSQDVATTTLGLIGKQSPSGQKTARLESIASEWIQAQIEYARQLGWEGECDQANCTWYLPGPATSCGGSTVSPATSISTAIGNGPALPSDFTAAKIAVSWDANTPSDSSTSPATKYLQLVEVDLYHTLADCNAGNAYQQSYTSVSTR